MDTNEKLPPAHTPGPWVISRYNDGQYSVNYQTQGERFVPDAEDIANARLIAAAPELLELAQQIVLDEETGSHLIPLDIVKSARSLIDRILSK